MKKFCLVLPLLCLLSFVAVAQDNITDSVDVLHYDMHLDVGNKYSNQIDGYVRVTAHVLRTLDSLSLELSDGIVDSVLVDGVVVPHTFSSQIIRMPYSGNADDTVSITVFYRKGEKIMANGWGGFYFDNNIYYNLGIAIYAYPHNVGKTWFPCRDNFYDKATYHLEITSKPGWKAICSGMPDSTVSHSDGSATYCWTLHQPAPTYLVGVAVAPFHVIERQYSGLNQNYPAILGFLQHDSINVWNVFDHLNRVIPFYEECFGPYRWERVGYVSTPKGSMEHCGNIAFTTQCMANDQEACLATMSHEYAHSWFGNLVTCSSSQNMWINEGGASFAEEVAIQAICPDGDSLRYKGFADDNLNDVLCHAHLSDGDFIPVYGVDSAHTYGTTVYRKGATVWHSLRGYMGDSLFYSSMRKLFDRCAFQNIDSYQLRDSLSLYSGIDLAPFFDFHVFGPGFNDYVISALVSDDNGSTMISVKQKNYGTVNLLRDNRLWMSFFSESGERVDKYVHFWGEEEEFHFDLPFKAAFAIVDFDKLLSKASICTPMQVDHNGAYDAANSHFICNASRIADTNKASLFITHHWCNPDSSAQPRYARLADRYWDVQGFLPLSAKIQGRFHFSRSGADRSLDNNLYDGEDDFQQLKLMYREGPGHEWVQFSGITTGTTSEGYFVVNTLKIGQYTLCLVDTNYALDISESVNGSSSVTVFPNPSHGTVTIATSNPGEPLLVSIVDHTGKRILDNLQTVSGQTLDLLKCTHACAFQQGVYLFHVKAPNSGIVETIKVYIK